MWWNKIWRERCWSCCRAPVQTSFYLPVETRIRGFSRASKQRHKDVDTCALFAPWCQRPWWSRTAGGCPSPDRRRHSISCSSWSCGPLWRPGPQPTTVSMEDKKDLNNREKTRKQLVAVRTVQQVVGCDANASNLLCYINNFSSAGNVKRVAPTTMRFFFLYMKKKANFKAKKHNIFTGIKLV